MHFRNTWAGQQLFLSLSIEQSPSLLEPCKLSSVTRWPCGGQVSAAEMITVNLTSLLFLCPPHHGLSETLVFLIERLRCLGHGELAYTEAQQNGHSVGKGLETVSLCLQSVMVWVVTALGFLKSSSDNGPLYYLGVVPESLLETACCLGCRPLLH